MDLSRETPEALDWQSDHDARAAAYLGGLPGRAGLARRVARYLVDTRRSPLIRRGQRWFQSVVLEPDAEFPVVVVRDAPTAEPRVLVDPNALTAKRGVPVALDWYEPSPDGALLAYGVSAAGTEVFELGVIDVVTGDPIPDEVPSNVQAVSWLPDSSGFWCATRSFADGTFRMPIFRHILGEPLGSPVELPPDLSFPHPKVFADGRHILIATGNTEYRLDWVIRDGELRPLLRDIPGAHVGVVHGDDLIAIVDGDAPRGRLVRIPVPTAADRSTWTELLAETDDVLRTVDVVDDVIVLGYLHDAACRVRTMSLQGNLLTEVDLPGDGVVSTVAAGVAHPGLAMFASGGGEISFIYSTPDAAPAVYRYVLAEQRLEIALPPAARIDGLMVSTITATSADGTPIPAHIVHRRDLDPSVPHPTLIHGYGGFNLAWLPSFLAADAAWVEAGGIYVRPHLRGGSDYGADWWRQGAREHKQHTFDDLYAVAEHLIATGRTTRGQLAVKGESNGGLLAGAAIAQRPDLWAAVVADVPILDLLAMDRDPLTYAIGRGEYGDPRDPVEAEWLRAISPVEHVEPASYPAVLVSAGANDPRCPAWHSRLFVDRLERAQQGDAPILLRVYGDQGHGAAGTAAMAEKEADWLAFAAAATGLAL